MRSYRQHALARIARAQASFSQLPAPHQVRARGAAGGPIAVQALVQDFALNMTALRRAVDTNFAFVLAAADSCPFPATEVPECMRASL